jgi:hypothetical protein
MSLFHDASYLSTLSAREVYFSVLEDPKATSREKYLAELNYDADLKLDETFDEISKYEFCLRKARAETDTLLAWLEQSDDAEPLTNPDFFATLHAKVGDVLALLEISDPKKGKRS